MRGIRTHSPDRLPPLAWASVVYSKEKRRYHTCSSSPPSCMTFRHRHVRRRRLIELAEVEEGKAEAGERKPEAREEEKRAIREQSGSGNHLLLVPRHLYLARDKGLPTLAPVAGKPLRTSADTRTTQAPCSHRDGCRIFLDPRTEERRRAAKASCWMDCKYSSRAISCPTRPLMGSRLTI